MFLKRIVNKKTSIPLVIILLILSVTIYYLFISDELGNNKYKKLLTPDEALLLLNFPEKTRRFKGGVVEKMTVVNALGAASIAGKFNFKASSKILEIDNYPTTDQKQWYCYINDKEIQENLSKKIIYPQDKILMIYR